jgi:hypothetical protein
MLLLRGVHIAESVVLFKSRVACFGLAPYL